MSNIMMLRIGFIAALFALGLYLLSPMITPFFLGALLAYLGNPVVTYLHSKYVPRTLGVVLVFLIVILLLVVAICILVPMIQAQVTLAVQKIPEMLQWLQKSLLPWMNSHIPGNDNFDAAAIKKQLAQHSEKAGNIVGLVLATATHSTLAMIDFVMDVILVPVVAFYLMRDWPKIMINIQQQLSPSSRQGIVDTARECDEVVGAFFKGQLLVMIVLAGLYSLGLGLIGLQVAIFVGLLSGLLTIVPYLGFTIGIVVATIAMYFETHEWLHVFYVWGIYGVGQAIESMVLTPLLVGDKIGLHPVVVIFAILTGGTLFGFLGVLLALPVAAVILVVLKRTIAYRGNHAAGA